MGFLRKRACVCLVVGLFVTLWTVACQAPLSIGFSMQEYWGGLPCPPPGGSSQLSDQILVSYHPCTGRLLLYHKHHLGRASLGREKQALSGESKLELVESKALSMSEKGGTQIEAESLRGCLCEKWNVKNSGLVWILDTWPSFNCFVQLFKSKEIGWTPIRKRFSPLNHSFLINLQPNYIWNNITDVSNCINNWNILRVLQCVSHIYLIYFSKSRVLVYPCYNPVSCTCSIPRNIGSHVEHRLKFG